MRKEIKNTIEKFEQAGFKVRIFHYRLFWDRKHLLSKENGDPGFKHNKKYVLKRYGRSCGWFPEEGEDFFQQSFLILSNFGGATVLRAEHTDGTVFLGESECSKKDQFCYRKGVRLAFEQILKRDYIFESLPGAAERFLTGLQKQNAKA